jgi:hypothetical protein
MARRYPLRRGKIYNGSYGKRRPHRAQTCRSGDCGTSARRLWRIRMEPKRRLFV